MNTQLYPEIEQDRSAALRLILKLWGWDSVNEWNKTINKRIAEKLRGEAANTLPNFVFLDAPKGNGREGVIVVEESLTFSDSLDDDTSLPPITEEFLSAMDETYADGASVGLLKIIRRWRDGELIVPQVARLIDESDWPLPDRLNRAHKAFMLDWEGAAYEGRHVDKPKRTNWVHHVDYYTDGTVGIERHGQVKPRIYHPTAASLNRLDCAMLMWRNYGATKQQFAEGLKNRAMAPMRKSDGTFA